jgi:pyridoxamine 5'-phosphate oxidase
MKLSDVTQFANANPICYLATADGDQPHVRGMMLWYADETGFYFHSGGPKRLIGQLKKNPKAEACFFQPPQTPPGGTMMRVAGKVEFVDDLTLKARLLEERPFLKSLGIDDPSNPMLVVFRIYTGEAHFWTMAENMRESETERVKF